MLGDRQKLLVLSLIMIVVAVGGAVISMAILYDTAFEEERARLVESAQSQARLIEAVARFDAKHSPDDVPGGAFEATLSQLRAAHAEFEGFGETGEFTVAKKEGDHIVFLLSHRHGGLSSPEPVPFSSDLAQPMRNALSGSAGTIVGRDYRGATVLAAYEPLAVLNIGIVAKIDLSEIRAPFIRAGIYAGASALGLTLLGLVLFFRLANPMVRSLMSHTADLNEEIRERMRSEEGLIESERLLNQAQKMAHVGSYSRDIITGKLVWSNEQYRIFGYKPGEIDPTFDLVYEHVSPGDRQRFLKANEALVEREEPYDLEYRILRKDGEVREVRSISTLERDASGKIIRQTGALQDITNRMLAERDLLESEDRYRILVEHAPEAIVVMDLDLLRFVDANANAEQLFKFSRAELCTKSPLDVSPTTQPNGRPSDEYAIELLQQAAEGQTPVFEWTHSDSEGKEIVCDSRLVRLPSASRTLIRGSLTDIRGRKRAEAERLHLERQVQHAQKLESLGVLAGGIAHDFNNLLMAILGNADLALGRVAPHSPTYKNLQGIEEASRRAADLTQQMLAYSGMGHFVIEPIDLNELIRETGSLLQASISKSAALKYNFDPNLPRFDGDATQIRQIIMNLVTNASEAIGEQSGEISLSTGVMDCDRVFLDSIEGRPHATEDERLSEGIYAYLEVGDTGSGMDAETIEKIFDPFFTTKFTGRGLGMSAVLGIIRGHKGTVRVYSEIDKGSVFKMLFPLNNISERDSSGDGPVGSNATSWRGKGVVLLVDDEDSVCTVGTQMLEHLGFEVLTACDGRQALEVYSENADKIVCVLLDLTMPDMNGEQTFWEIRRIRPKARVVLCSGYTAEVATQGPLSKGLAGFIQKPYSIQTLEDSLRKALSADEPSEPG
ncbi:MAG: PAS domain S-box protein [Halieaceae bacterium]|jgi:PAS domain S-box-containing protein|nr:PAS domain S-box protein [Halieaceae bacterium]